MLIDSLRHAIDFSGKKVDFWTEMYLSKNQYDT